MIPADLATFTDWLRSCARPPRSGLAASGAQTRGRVSCGSPVSNVKTALVDSLPTSSRTAVVEQESMTQLVLKLSPQQREELMRAMYLSRQDGTSNSH